MGLFNFIKNFFIKKPKKIPKKRKEKTYGLLKFQYKNYYKIGRITQRRAIKDNNRYIRNFVRKYKRNPNRIELGRIVRGSSHKTIAYRKGNSGHWKRQWLRQYIYGLHKISYNKK